MKIYLLTLLKTKILNNTNNNRKRGFPVSLASILLVCLAFFEYCFNSSVMYVSPSPSSSEVSLPSCEVGAVSDGVLLTGVLLDGVVLVGVLLLIFYLYTCYVSHAINLPTLEMFFNHSANTGNSSINTGNSNSVPSKFSIETLAFLIKSEIFGFYDQCVRLFTFGWLTYNSPILITLSLIYYGLIGFFYPENSEIDLKYKIISFLVILIIYSATFFAMIDYSLYHCPDATLIQGVQGRYFIPLLSLMPLVFNINKNRRFKDMDLWILTALLIILSSFVMLTIVFYY